MELTESKIKCLINEENINKVNEDALDQILTIALSHICGKSDTEGLVNIGGSEPDAVKAVYADVTKLLIETARLNSTPEDLTSVLQCTVLNKEYTDRISEFYANHKEKLQESLESIGSGLPHVIDVDWQLDYCIKSSISNAAGFPVYSVSLGTKKKGSIENVKFTCTIQQLQDLVHKLKDAARHTEKLTNS